MYAKRTAIRILLYDKTRVPFFISYLINAMYVIFSIEHVVCNHVIKVQEQVTITCSHFVTNNRLKHKPFGKLFYSDGTSQM